jgi:4-hydroxy-3-polyprenylbenzoate decarboxylase
MQHVSHAPRLLRDRMNTTRNKDSIVRYQNMQQLLEDLEKTGQLVKVTEEVDPYLEIAEIQRRAYRAQAPAILFTRVKGTPFPMVCNVFGTLARAGRRVQTQD